VNIHSILERHALVEKSYQQKSVFQAACQNNAIDIGLKSAVFVSFPHSVLVATPFTLSLLATPLADVSPLSSLACHPIGEME
jgi:hypothetical protein